MQNYRKYHTWTCLEIGGTNKENWNRMYSSSNTCFVLKMHVGGRTVSAYIFSFSLRLQTEVVNICMNPTGNLFSFKDMTFLDLIFFDHLLFGVRHRIYGLYCSPWSSLRVPGNNCCVLDCFSSPGACCPGTIRDMFLSFLLWVIWIKREVY